MSGETTSRAPDPSIPPPSPVAVIVSRYNASITDALLDGARRVWVENGGEADALAIVDAPGSFELPVLALAAATARTGCLPHPRVAGIVALGCLIRGQTMHDRHIARAVAHGLVSVSLKTDVPVTFGVLTVDTPEQAQDRAGGSRRNKGADAMHALLETMRSIRTLGDGTLLRSYANRRRHLQAGGGR